MCCQKLIIRQRQKCWQDLNGQCSMLGLLGKAYFVLLVEVHITRKKINFLKSFFMNYVWAGTSSSLQYFI